MGRKYGLFFCQIACGLNLLIFTSQGELNAAYDSAAYNQEETNHNSFRRHATGREEIAYSDERDRDIHERANRKGDWDYKQNWRYDRKAFYSGETQGEAYEEEHPEGSGGPGMSADSSYLKMRDYYLKESKPGTPHGYPNQTAPDQTASGQTASGWPRRAP